MEVKGRAKTNGLTLPCSKSLKKKKKKEEEEEENDDDDDDDEEQERIKDIRVLFKGVLSFLIWEMVNILMSPQHVIFISLCLFSKIF